MHIYVKIYQHVSGCQQVFGLGKYGENINTICPSFSDLFQLWFTSSVRSGAHWVFLVSAERCGCITTAFEQHEQVYIIYIAPYLHIYLCIKVWKFYLLLYWIPLKTLSHSSIYMFFYESQFYYLVSLTSEKQSTQQRGHFSFKGGLFKEFWL